MAKAPTSPPPLADAIRAAIPAAPGRMKAWHETVAPEVMAELETIRAAFWAGDLGPSKHGVARAVSRELKARNIADIGFQGVIAWLHLGKPSPPR